MIEAIYVTSEAKADPVGVQSAVALADAGLEGDRYAVGAGTWSNSKRGGRQLTLIDAAVLDGLPELSDGRHRRNVVVRGVDLDVLAGHRLRIGDAELVAVRPCPPCDHLEGLTAPGMRAALEGRGGLRCDVVRGGTISVGDPIITLD